MKFSAAVVAALCTAVLAAPAPAGLARRSRASRATHFQQRTKERSAGSSDYTFGHLVKSSKSSFGSANHSSADELDENWAGVVVQPGKNQITGVSAYFVLPEIKLPTDGAQVAASTHTASTWVGIDGYSCGTGLWQAGVDGNIDESGSVSWYAWYEWYPADTVAIELGDLAAGDTIFVNVTASSTTKGTVYMENQAAGKSFTKTVTSSDKLCLADAEWIEEDLVADTTAEGLANFTSVTFTSATAYTKSGTLPPTKDTNVMDIEDSNNYQLTQTSYTDDSVTIKYL